MTALADSMCKRVIGSLTGLIMVTALLATTALMAQDVPPQPQAAIIVRVLAYDRNLKTRSGKGVVVGVIYRDDAGYKAEKDQVVAAFKAFESQPVQGLPLRTVSHPVRDAKELGDWIAKEGPNVIYLAPNVADLIDPIQAICAQRKAVAVTGVRSMVEKGIPIGVVLKDKKPALIINLPASKSAGMDIDPKVLQLAEVIR